MPTSNVMNAQTAHSAEALIRSVAGAAARTLEVATDRWGRERTPLLVDGFEVATGEPVTWLWEGRERVASNLANQQDLLRTLVGLTALTGEPRWRETAIQIARFALEQITHEPTGLLHWGGHGAWDLRHGESFGHAKHKRHHELKRHYPFYELLWEADATRIERFVGAFWDAHITDWSILDFGRHGRYEPVSRSVPIWDDAYVGGPVFFPAQGLSFVNTGSDLFYAAAMLHRSTGDPKPLTWSLHLAQRYAETRNSETGLSGYQFSCVAGGDRAQKQLGPEFGPGALEGTVLAAGQLSTRYAWVGICQLQLARELGEAGEPFLDWAVRDLTALARHVYDEQRNLLRPMLTDGRPLSASDIRRPGYYRAESFEPVVPGAHFVRAYAMAYRATRDEQFWHVARQMLRGWRMDIDAPHGSSCTFAADAPADVDLLMALLELWRATERPDLLAAASEVGSALLAAHLHQGLFMPRATCRYVRCNSRVPLALLHLAAALLGREESTVPIERGSDCYMSCEHEGMAHLADKWQRVTDNRVIYGQDV